MPIPSYIHPMAVCPISSEIIYIALAWRNEWFRLARRIQYAMQEGKLNIKTSCSLPNGITDMNTKSITTHVTCLFVCLFICAFFVFPHTFTHTPWSSSTLLPPAYCDGHHLCFTYIALLLLYDEFHSEFVRYLLVGFHDHHSS